MREIKCVEITAAVKALFWEANWCLNEDIREGLKAGVSGEESGTGRFLLEKILENADLAEEKKRPMCQDTGMAIVFVELGQQVIITGGLLGHAIQEGVAQAYNLDMRKSVVLDPFDRKNTGDNTPAVIHYDVVEGDHVKISVMPKGFGSENMSSLKMLTPAEGVEGFKSFVLDTVKLAGANPCPPMVVGIGVGGTFEKVALLAKQALLRPIHNRNSNAFYGALEQELLEKINDTGIGPQGLGGRITALGVLIESFPTHIAGLPVAVNISCHATRHRSIVL